MAQQGSVVGVYDTLAKAESAVRALGDRKYPIDQISIIAKHLEHEKQVHGYVTACDVSKQGAQSGAWLGGLFGLLAGAAVLWLPGFGPLVMIGSAASVLLGGAEGALAGAAIGGIFSGLAAWGISKEHILKYQDVVKAGKYLVVAHGNTSEVAEARMILAASDSTELNLYPAA